MPQKPSLSLFLLYPFWGFFCSFSKYVIWFFYHPPTPLIWVVLVIFQLPKICVCVCVCVF
jgi:hypothetical protein